MAGVTLLYLAAQIVAQGVLGSSLAGQKAPLAEAAAVVLGGPGRTLILVGSAISMFGHVSGMTLAVPRMLFAFACGGFLPAPVARVHARFRTPYIAIALQVLVVMALALSGTFEKLAIIANGSILIVYLACCAAVLELRRRGVQEGGVPFRAPFASVIPVLAIAFIVWLLASLTADEWKWLTVALGVAVVVYAASLPGRRAASAAAAETPA
jgi:amino acid transporter